MTQLLSKEPNKREVSDRVNQVLKGALNNTGSVTLTANVTTTTVSNAGVHSDSRIFLTPTTVNAAAESAYISSVTSKQFVITHANAASTDRTFYYCFLG